MKKLPWYSVPEGRAAFPARANQRRRRRRNIRAQNDAVALPALESAEEEVAATADSQNEEPSSEASTIAAPSEQETPATSQAPSESDFTTASTPATPAQAPASSPKPTPTQQTHIRRDTRTAIAVPSIPGLYRPKWKEATSPAPAGKDIAEKQQQVTANAAEQQQSATEESAAPASDGTLKTPPPKPAPAPKSWADLVKRNTKTQAPAAKGNGEVTANGFQLPKNASFADALKQYRVQNGGSLDFLEPRGLVNTGNMCYMNSVSRSRICKVIFLTVSRFFKFLFSVFPSTISWIKCGSELSIR